MAGHSILYLGRAGFAADFLERLEAADYCQSVKQSESMLAPDIDADTADVVMFEAGPGIVSAGSSLSELRRAYGQYPLIALTTREHEHRGIAAQREGVQGYLCVDEASADEARAVVEHAVRRHRLMQQLSDTDSTVLSILSSINDGVIVVDTKGVLIDINPAARSILGLSAREIPDDNWCTTFGSLAADGETTVSSRDLPLPKAGRGEGFANFIAVHRAPGQSDITLDMNGQGLYDGAGTRLGGVVTFRDVTEVMERQVKLEEHAQYDELTGLPNRRLFIHQLEKAIGRSQRSDVPLAVLLVDVDKLKSVNDTLGHDTGDALLRDIGKRLAGNLRVGDFCGRWGGDEFVVCAEDIDDADSAAALAQKIGLLLSEKYRLLDSELFATASVGIALYPESAGTAERVVKAAKMAMQQAKRHGGGRFQYYSSSLNRRMEQREELEMGLRHALVRDEFVLHYQPRIDVESGRLIGLEALLRWQHPRFGLLPPARFLSILETSGLIHSAGEWVIATACRQLAAWQHQFELPDLTIAIKLSSQQLRHGRLVDTVSHTLADSLLDAGCVEFEVGDDFIVRQRSAELETLRGLRKLGVRLSLDNFGTTEVSLNALNTGVIDSFVLDQSLIQDIEQNDSHQRIVRAAIAMARGLDIEVAADGVETMTQLEYLKNCHCDLAQGFLISRPVQADKIPSMLRSEVAGTRLLASVIS